MMRFYVRRQIFALCLMTLSVCAGVPVLGQDNPVKNGLNYLIDLEDVRNHYITVEMTVPVTGDQTQLMMAVWTPGSYLVREYARHIDSLKFTNSTGENIQFAKTRKNRWTVETKGLAEFKVRYRLYCNEMSVRTNWVGHEFAMLNGGSTFMTVPDRLNQEHVVELKMPRHWTRSATSLNAAGEKPHRYVAQNFDELVDSPIVAGNINIYPFATGGVQHQLVNIGESGYWDGTKAATDLKKLVDAHQQMWRVVPYDRYLFLNVISGSGGGLEHDNSCLMMTSLWSFRDDDRYKNWLSLASHEFFHTWNVRRLRPKGLMKYDYENENYTRGLWVAEGITSYYEDLLLIRAGLISKDEYLKRLNKDIESVKKRIGRKRQSLTESSFDTWIKFYRPDENSTNTTISYYSKGAVVGFLLDGKIRELTGGQRSLDDVMRQMYEKYLDTGYSSSDFRAVVNDIVGKDTSDWFASAVDSTDELDFEPVKDWFGLEFPDDEEKTATETDDEITDDEAVDENGNGDETADEKTDDSATKITPKEPEPGTRWLGFSGSDRVSRVEADSPATDAGINTGDEILAVNGFRLTRGIESRLKQYEIGDELELLISRRGQIMTLKITIGSKVAKSWRLKIAKKQTVEQKRNFNAWLGLEEPPNNGVDAKEEKPK